MLLTGYYGSNLRMEEGLKTELINGNNARDRRFLIRHWFYIGILALAWFQIFLFPAEPEYLIDPILLGIGASVYTSFKIIQPLHWHESRWHNILLFVLDLVVCGTLVITSGGLHSPFILYALTPVMTAAILLGRIYTAIITLVTFGYVLAGCYLHSTVEQFDSLSDLNDFATFLLALSLTAVLPYLMNVKDRQDIKVKAVLSERQKLAREIHDNLCQTIYGLRWQIQMLRSGMLQFDQSTANEKINELLEEAETDARNLIGSLRSFKFGCSLVAELKTYLSKCETECKISYALEESGQDFEVDDLVKSEVLQICEEAIRNAIKHSKCSHVVIKLLGSNNRLKVIVSDDGYGFNHTRFVEGRGLMVMKERAETVGGSLKVSSRPGTGTEIQLEVPRRCPSELILANR